MYISNWKMPYPASVGVYTMFLCVFPFLIFFMKAYVVGTQVGAIQMGTHNICLYKEVYMKYIGCNLKPWNGIACGVCAITKSNTVSKIWVILHQYAPMSLCVVHVLMLYTVDFRFLDFANLE